MKTYQLTYKSDASDFFNEDNLKKKFENYREEKKNINVTGCLIVHKKQFFQILEGRKEIVLQLFEEIKKDKRNHSVQLICKGYTKERLYETWGMVLYRPIDVFLIQEEMDAFEEGLLLLSHLSSPSRSECEKSFWLDIKKKLFP